jgi:hypothetical protein
MPPDAPKPTWRWMPYYRWTGFAAHQNPNGTWHIIVTDDGGGRRLIADDIPDQDEAEWIARTLTDALPAEQRA